MKICLLNTFDQGGGAARACHRLYDGLTCSGADVTLLVREKSGDDKAVKACDTRFGGRLRALLEGGLLHCYPKRQLHNFSMALMPARGIDAANCLNPDILHLHWVSHGFIRIEDLIKTTAPIVWTMHDSWPFSGGCHLPGSCLKYQEQCGECPILGSDKVCDLSRRGWERKQKSYPLDRMTFVAPSRWLADRAESSSLLKGRSVEVIPNGVDTSLYSPGESVKARTSLGLPAERKLILFGAWNALTDHNKGADLLWKAMASLPAEMRNQCTVIVFGERSSKVSVPDGLSVINLGLVDDDSQTVELYRAADLLVMPSRQENLPNMVVEAMSCGLPCVAFSVGGIPEQIIHRENGCLVEPYDTEAMSFEIAWLLCADTERKSLGLKARSFALESYSLQAVAQQHIALYEKVVRPASPS